MRKQISVLLTAIMLLCTLPAHASKIGDVVGTVYNTDIVAYVNNYAIPSYAANGTSVIVAEDLRNFGFDVVWNSDERSLYISRNTTTQPAEMAVEKGGTPNSKFADLLYTDIAVYANGIKIPSYAINGYTMIPMESLTMFGECNWVSEQRALKMWVDGLHIRNEMQPIKKEISTPDLSIYNGYYKGGGTRIPGENYYIGRWSASLSNVTSDSLDLSFGQSESDYYISITLYRQPNGSYYGSGISSWDKYSYITIWLESPQKISLTVTGSADSIGTETLYRE